MAKVIYTKEPQEFVGKLAVALKNVKEFGKPEWVDYVKSGMSRERPPIDDDFWYFRAASILRQLYIKGVVGVGKLRTRYGAKKNRGGQPSKFYKSGGKIIRVILQQAEAAGLVEKIDRLQHGRRLTKKGRDFLDAIEVSEKKVEEVIGKTNSEVKKEMEEKENGKEEPIQELNTEEVEKNGKQESNKQK